MPTRASVSLRRRNWLNRRKRAGHKRPRPLEVGVVNAMGVTADPEKVRAILRRAAQEADVLFCSEVANVKVGLALGDAWQVAQFGAVGSADAGCALAVRRSVGNLEHVRKVAASQAGHGIRGRSIVAARVCVDHKPYRWCFDAAASHAPPKRAWALWDGYMGVLRRERTDVAGADFNKLARAVAPALGRKVRAVEIVGLAHRFWIPSSKPRQVGVGSDHPMVVITLWPLTHDKKEQQWRQRKN